MAPTAAQAQKTAAQWNATDKSAFTEELFHTMFRMHPEWRPMFKSMPAGDVDYSNATWKQQINATRDLLDVCINTCAKDQDELVASLKPVAQRHTARNVTQPHFQKMKECLVDVAKRKVSGLDEAAWLPVVHFICDNVKE